MFQLQVVSPRRYQVEKKRKYLQIIQKNSILEVVRAQTEKCKDTGRILVIYTINFPIHSKELIEKGKI